MTKNTNDAMLYLNKVGWRLLLVSGFHFESRCSHIPGCWMPSLRRRKEVKHEDKAQADNHVLTQNSQNQMRGGIE